MLLRSITKHVKDQNWFAVALDFFIVVVGILIAFQITNWNEDRALTKRTNKLVERLETDFGTDVWLAIGLHNYHKQVYEDALLALDDITGRRPLSDEAFLISAYRATQFNRFNQSTSIYDELVSTGGLELVVKTEIGALASIFYETTLLSDYEKFGQSSDYRNIFRGAVPINVQLAVGNACGDRTRTLDEIMSESSFLGYDCELDLTADQMAEAAQVLRLHPSIVPALRHRVATLKTQNYDFEGVVDAIRPFRATREVLEQSTVNTVWVTE